MSQWQSHQCRLHLLGPFRIDCEGNAVRLPTRETRLLLAYLVLHPESHARERLAALCWPEVPDASARASLRNALSTLRRELGPGLLRADRESVQLSPDFHAWVDAAEFQRQAQCYLANPVAAPNAVDLDLYEGDLLADFHADWVWPEREAFRDLYLGTLLELTRQMRSRGEYEQAIAFAERVVARDRANERAHQHLMFCHLALGDRVAALKQFAACRSALVDELAVEPSRETEQLHDWIRHTPSQRPALEASVTNLPVPLTSFVGRQREMAAVKDQLSAVRLLTLTGAGGSGKTRLAIEAATDLVDAFSDGVWWVELAVVSDAELLPRSVAKTLGVPEVPNQPVSDTLEKFLGSREILLVLDNCEHLVAACAALVERLLQRCPQLEVLATSREKLGVPGESAWAVPALAVPDPGEALPVSRLLECPAVDLFMRRAKAVDPAFVLTEANAPAVADICRRVDGLPLAIELAAARVNALTAGQIAARLDDSFQLLNSGNRTALAHHQTLRAAIDWSFDILSPKEQVLLKRLSVFAGGWMLPAAEKVCSRGGVAEEEIVDLLSGLVDKSLVEVRQQGEEKRFWLLETIRQYAREGLLESGEFATLRTRHLRFFCGLVEAANPHLGFMLPDAEMDYWLDRLDREQDNLRAAVRWSLTPQFVPPAEQEVLTELGLRLAGLQHAFWFARGRLAEGRGWLVQLLESSADVPVATRAQALLTAGYLACWQGDFAAGRLPLEEALSLLNRQENDSGIALATHGLGFVALGEGDAALGRSLFEASLRMARGAGDKWVASFATHFLAVVHSYQGEFVRAAAHFEEGNELIRSVGGHRQALAFSQFHLGRIARLQGDFSAARSCHVEGLRLFRQVGDRRGIGYSLAGFAALAAAVEDGERAARLSGAVASLEAVIGSFLEAPLQYEYDRALAGAREALGADAFTAAAAAGRALRLQQAIEYALESPP